MPTTTWRCRASQGHTTKLFLSIPKATSSCSAQAVAKKMDGLSVTQKAKAAEEDSDASPPCHSMATSLSNGGTRRRDGRTYYLDRHTVDCGPQHVMRQWNLYRSGDNVRINYQCCEVPGGVYHYYERKWTPRYGGDAESLNGLVKLGAVDCGNNLLPKWKLVRNEDPFELNTGVQSPNLQACLVFGLNMDLGKMMALVMDGRCTWTDTTSHVQTRDHTCRNGTFCAQVRTMTRTSKWCMAA